MNIAVLYGGKSGEHEVSLVSASSVVRHINRTKHKILLIGIAKNGRWYMQEERELQRILTDDKAVLQIAETPASAVHIVPGGGTAEALQKSVRSENGTWYTEALAADIVFPVLHGTYGEDGLVQGLLEMAELPYCGCGTVSSALAMDKEQTKKIWLYAGLPVVPFICVKTADMLSADFNALREKAEKSFGYPLFVKPCSAGSSVGAAKVHSKDEFEAAVRNAFVWDEKILIERCIDAREIECSVTGNSASPLSAQTAVRSYAIGEIAPSHGFYDYEAKYTDPNGAKLLIPAPLTEEQSARIKITAEKAYSVLDCSGLARVDFFIDKKDGSLYLNEINTLPGFTSISMFPKMCEAGGLMYENLIELLLEEGLERFKKRRSLKTSFV